MESGALSRGREAFEDFSGREALAGYPSLHCCSALCQVMPTRDFERTDFPDIMTSWHVPSYCSPNEDCRLRVTCIFSHDNRRLLDHKNGRALQAAPKGDCASA